MRGRIEDPSTSTSCRAGTHVPRSQFVSEFDRLILHLLQISLRRCAVALAGATIGKTASRWLELVHPRQTEMKGSRGFALCAPRARAPTEFMSRFLWGCFYFPHTQPPPTPNPKRTFKRCELRFPPPDTPQTTKSPPSPCQRMHCAPWMQHDHWVHFSTSTLHTLQWASNRRYE